MRFRVTHTTIYEYAEPIFLEHQVIRLRPRADPAQEVLDYRLDIEPQPSLLTKALDAEGDSIFVAWFPNLTQRLRIRSACEVETLRRNPFDYLLTRAEYARLPLTYDAALRARLETYCRVSGEEGDAVATFLAPVAEESGWHTVSFLSLLAKRIYETHEVIVRHEGSPWDPFQTLERRQGACRDLSILFAECCRRLGLAARFVSGYQQGDPDERLKDLHAWTEVYLPGGGWRGYDPTHGLAVADRHVALASGASPAEAAPVTGSFRGPDAQSAFSAKIEIRTH